MEEEIRAVREELREQLRGLREDLQSQNGWLERLVTLLEKVAGKWGIG